MAICCKLLHSQTSYLVPRYNTISDIIWHKPIWPWLKVKVTTEGQRSQTWRCLRSLNASCFILFYFIFFFLRQWLFSTSFYIILLEKYPHKNAPLSLRFAFTFSVASLSQALCFALTFHLLCSLRLRVTHILRCTFCAQENFIKKISVSQSTQNAQTQVNFVNIWLKVKVLVTNYPFLSHKKNFDSMFLSVSVQKNFF